MNFFSLPSFFKKNKNHLYTTDSILVKRIRSLAKNSSLEIFRSATIYHHTKRYTIPLLIFDNLRGLYLFEIKEWSYDDLKSATAEKAQHQESGKNTLSYDNSQDIIRTKFNEIIHNDGVPIFNYLIMENLSASEYEHLNDSFKELLPFDKLIFNDTSESDIFKKLQSAAQENHSLPPLDTVIGTLLIQYAILDHDSRPHLCTQEQRDFLDAPLERLLHFNAPAASGKSTLLLLKAILELLEDSSLKIVIIKPSTLAADILKKRLLEIIEHAIIELNLTSIEILTPIEVVNRHLIKRNKKPLSDSFHLDSELQNKSFNLADIVLCDDSFLYQNNFLSYLSNLQKRKKLLLVNPKESLQSRSLIHSFIEQREVTFHQTNPHARAMHLIYALLQKCKPHEILVVSNTLSREKLKDDLEGYIESSLVTLEGGEHLLYQDFSGVLLATYADINAVSAKHIIILDLCFTNLYEIEYAFHLAQKTVDILYEEDCQEIINLRKLYESEQE